MIRGVFLIAATLVTQFSYADDRVQFNRDIRPILADNCFACHGPDQNQRKAKLRLDVREEAIARGAFIAGKSAESELVNRLNSSDSETVMPPLHSNKKLSQDQKKLIAKWIDQGAEYQGHWAYDLPAKTSLPKNADAIDFFIQKRLQSVGLTPAKEADRRILARRLSFDLIGLPPTPEEVDAFTADQNPDYYSRYVEKLISKPQYGERMAVTWLDVVRFADTIGYHSDNPRNVWPYRDYVIQSFYQNKRFDTFTIEQLAGDLLPNSTQEQKIGSCFNRLLLQTEEGGAQSKDYEARMLADRVRAVGTVWLGQTLGCCQCHDHKFDPFSQKEFYALGAFFADIQEPIIGRPEPGMFVTNASQDKTLGELKSAVAQARSMASLFGVAPAGLAQKKFNSFEDSIPRCIVSKSMPKPRTVKILPRGNWQIETGEKVQPTFPISISKSSSKNDQKLTRLDLAKWIVSKENPLTARVFVNRLWKQFFGTGLSKTTEDFGSQGEWPTHPELLDWLAVEFIESGWDVKHMIRLIVSSRTYRQASTASKELLAEDPYNREMARQSRYRLDAEFIRDSALAVSGLLANQIGGPSVKPYQPDGYWENLNFPTRQYSADEGESQYRRGLYTWWQRTFPHPAMLAFDAPTREECTAERPRSNIPQQALVLLNDPSFVESARVLALRVMKQTADSKKRLESAFQFVLQRKPNDDEVAVLLKLLEQHTQEYTSNKKAADDLLKVGFSTIPKETNLIELAAWTHVTRVILNLHETVTRN